MATGQRRSLAAVGEFGALRRLLPELGGGRGVIVGPGDDCAVVRGGERLLLTTDVLVEGVHFERSWQTATELGAKAVAVNLSDIAAMGGEPRYCLMSIGVPGSYPFADMRALHRGAQRAARGAGASFVGGNVSAAEKIFISIAVVGTAPQRPALRRGARSGDFIFVTGTLGDAAAGLRLLRSGHRQGSAARALVRRFIAPTPRLEAGRRLVKAGLVSSMIDISDGLVQDLGHVCESSGLGAVVLKTFMPLSAAYTRTIGDDPALALCGGEDYELLFTVPGAKVDRLRRLAPRLECGLRFIGQMVTRPLGVRIQERSGKLTTPRAGGHQHFQLSSGS